MCVCAWKEPKGGDENKNKQTKDEKKKGKKKNQTSPVPSCPVLSSPESIGLAAAREKVMHVCPA